MPARLKTLHKHIVALKLAGNGAAFDGRNFIDAGAEIERVPRVPGARKILRSYLVKLALRWTLIK